MPRVEAKNLEGFLQAVTNTRRAITNASKRAMTDAIKPIVTAYKGNLSAMANNQPSVVSKVGADGRRTYATRTTKLQNSPTSKVWPFPDRTGVAGIVGPKAGVAPHAHLVERGTRYRMRLRIGGKYKIVEFWITHGQMRRHEQDRNTGVMPAFGPLNRAVIATRGIVNNTLVKSLATHFASDR